MICSTAIGFSSEADHLPLYRIKDFEGFGRTYPNFIKRQQKPKAPARRKIRISNVRTHAFSRGGRTGCLLYRALGFYADEHITIPRKEATPNVWIILLLRMTTKPVDDKIVG